MSLAYFLTFWGIVAMIFSSVCWFGTWCENQSAPHWRWIFVVALIMTMIGSVI